MRRLVLALCVCSLTALALGAQTLGKATLAGMKYRLIGPFRGGRAEAVTGIAGNPFVWFFGAAGGGVWKTGNAGLTWQPIFDKEPVSSIGAIAVAPSDPNVIYVGTGEACLRGDISYGDGMYKSLDGGKTWIHIGLDDTRHIAKILVDPHDPNWLYVAAIGHAFGPNPQRGVFRSEDGGKTWQRVLYVDDQTGAVDLTFDGANPHVLFAAMYQEVRKPWTFISGGPGSGIYRSTDDGATWQRLTGHGLPDGILGRIGLAVSPADPDRVWALIEAKKGGLYESNDRGESWRFITGDHRFLERAFYYTHIFADPHSAETIYILDTSMYRSTDGGRTWTRLHAPHGDHHGLWINPANSQWLINGNDGGATISLDGGKTWSTQDNQPTAQFYHVAVDDQLFYYVYGAQQDNSTVAIASATDHGGIGPRDWYAVGGGESGYIAPEPGNSRIVFAGGNYGILTRWDKATNQAYLVSPAPVNMDGSAAASQKYRFQWTAPLAFSPFDRHTLYFGAQVLFKTVDGGQSWQVISPDLTRNDKSKQEMPGVPITKDSTSVEFYDTIFTIAPSPLARGEIWVGSDDGLVHLTRDDGAHWENVTPGGLPAWSKISLIEASPFSAGAAYVAVNRNKNDDLNPYIYKTDDYGRTWTKIVQGIPAGSYVHVVRADPERRGLLYAGTETGVYISFDDGGQWQPLRLNLPTVSIRDLAVHDGDLVVATHGRAFWILDDLAPLRQLTPAALSEPVHLFTPRPAYRFHDGGQGGHGRPGIGANPPRGIIVDYDLATLPKGDITLDVLDARGRVIRHFTSAKPDGGISGPEAESNNWQPPEPALPKKAGLNRFVWDMREAPPRPVPRAVYDTGLPEGVLVLPGKYQIRLTVDGKPFTAPCQVLADPRVKLPMTELQAQFELAGRVRDLLDADHAEVLAIRQLRDELTALERRLDPPSGAAGQVVTAAQALDRKITAIEDQLISRASTADEDQLNYGNMLSSQLAYFETAVEDGDAPPTRADLGQYEVLRGELKGLQDAWSAVLHSDVPQLNRLMRSAAIPAVGLGGVNDEAGPGR